MTTDWQEYWAEHTRKVGLDDPLVSVKRSRGGTAIGAEELDVLRSRVVSLLELAPTHDVLDLCCGNGLLTAALEPHCNRIVGVDFCEPLINDILSRTSKTEIIQADARAVEFPSNSFDRVLITAALQHFEPHDVIGLFRKAADVLRPNGLLVVTDIPDRPRMWNFFDTTDRQRAHFEGVERGDPVIGTWFDPAWLEKLALHVGFTTADSLRQPIELGDSHFRFDFCSRHADS